VSPATHPGRGRIDFMRVRGHGADYLARRALASAPLVVQHSEGISPWRSGHGTGLGRSEGEFANTNFSSNVGDLVAAAGPPGWEKHSW
jgi:hypothetical protein